MKKTHRSALWNQVIRFTPVALFLVVLTFVAGQAYYSNMSTELLSANALSTSGSSGHGESEDSDEDTDEDADEDDHADEVDDDTDEDADEVDDDANESDDDTDEDTDEVDDDMDEDNQDESNTGERVVTDGQALEIALRAIGLTAGDVDEFEVDYHESHNVYEIHIRKNILKGTILINATTGSIVEMEKKLEDDEEESDDEDEEEADADFTAYLANFPEIQHKLMEKLLKTADAGDRDALVALVLSLDEGVRADLLLAKEGHGSNHFFKEARHTLDEKGIDALREFLVSNHDMVDAVKEWDQSSLTARFAKELSALFARLEKITFTPKIAEKLHDQVSALLTAAEEGTLTPDLIKEFKEEMHDLIEEGKEDKVDEGLIPFEDVDPTDTESASGEFIDDITFLKEEGITTGFPDGKFHGEQSITRAEFMAMILRAQYGVVGLQQKLASVDLSILPSDVPHSSNLAKIIALAYEEGITQADGEFGFSRPVTRAEALVISARAFSVEIPSEIQAHFGDTRTLNTEFRSVINQAAEDGIIDGNNGKFYPGLAITRAQAAKVIRGVVLLWLEANPE